MDKVYPSHSPIHPQSFAHIPIHTHKELAGYWCILAQKRVSRKWIDTKLFQIQHAKM